MDMKINSKLIVSLRKNKGWSQHQLSIVSGVSLRTVQRVENEGNASMETLKSLASAFETDFKNLVSQTPKPKTLFKKFAASILLFSSLVSSIFVTSTTTAAPGVEIQAESVLVSADQTVTTFSGEARMLIPHTTTFEISTVSDNASPHQLIVSAENATFSILDALIIKVEEGLEIKAKEIKARNALE